MIEVRPFASLGHAHHGWLNARHHFSFAEYQDPQRVNWGRLRVWNDDEIAAGSGFPPHPHHDMEIITYVREGAITHRDNLGNQGRTEAGDVQVMSAGTGIAHSEYNREDVTARIFQIWILPDQQGEAPSWGARPFPKGERAGRFVVLASGRAGDEDAGDGAGGPAGEHGRPSRSRLPPSCYPRTGPSRGPRCTGAPGCPTTKQPQSGRIGLDLPRHRVG